MKIRHRATVLFLLLSLLPLAVMAGIAYSYGRRIIAENLGESFHYVAHGTADRIDRTLYEVYDSVQSWSATDLLQEVVTDDIDGKITAFLSRLKGGSGVFSSANVLNAEGEIVASSNPQWVGRDLSAEESFQKGLRGEYVLKDLHLCLLSNKMAVTFTHPIWAQFDKDKIIGVLQVDWDAENLAKMISLDKEMHRLEERGGIAVVRRDGLIISALGLSQKEVYTRNLITEGFQPAVRVVQREEGFQTHCAEGRDCLLVGYDYSHGRDDFRGFGWGVLVFQDAEVAFAHLKEFKSFVFSLGGIVAGVVIILALIASQDITEPLSKFSHVASRVAQGDFDVKVEVASRDEVGQLAESFNKMVQNLQQTTVSRDYVDAVLSHMTNSLMVLTPQGYIQTVNEATCQLLGYTKEELIGRFVEHVLISAQAGGGESQSIFEGQTIRAEERVYKAKDGRQIPVLFSSAPMRVGQGKTTGIICAAQDITARKLAEAERVRLAAALESTGDAILITDTDAVIQYVNPAFERLTGYSMNEAVGRKPSILKSGKQDAAFYSEMLDSLRRGRIWSGALINRRKDGSFYDAEETISLVRDASFKVVNYVAVQRDVTQRKRIENELKTMNEDLVKEQKAVQALFADLQKAHKELAEREKTLRGMFADLQKADNEIKKTQRQLLQSEKLASIGQLAAGVAHEINNPLGFVNSNLQTLEEYVARYAQLLDVIENLKKSIKDRSWEQADSAVAAAEGMEENLSLSFMIGDIKTLLKESKEGIERIKKIVLDLRTFAREDEDVVEMVNLEQIIDSILNIVGNEIKYKAELTKDYGGVPAIKGNSRKIGQVFINLLVNAAQAIEGRGTIRIKTCQKDDKVCVEVRDSGRGMDEAVMKKIFDPFFTTKPVGEGTGLGLSISYDIVKEHGGDIIVESRPGEGASFTVIFPLLSNPCASA